MTDQPEGDLIDDGRCPCGLELCQPYGPNCLYGPMPDAKVTTRTFPSGATMIVTEALGFRMAVLQTPWHEGDIYQLLAGAADPSTEGESQ